MKPAAFLTFLIAATISLHAEDLHPTADAAGFVPLFNGKDLAGWKTTGNWLVEPDGSISLHPREGEKGWQRYDAYFPPRSSMPTSRSTSNSKSTPRATAACSCASAI
jgi:hypothetical protein